MTTPATLRRTSGSSLRQIQQLRADIEQLTQECGRLRVENRQLSIDLDDALDREQFHAMDAAQERLVSVLSRYELPKCDTGNSTKRRA